VYSVGCRAGLGLTGLRSNFLERRIGNGDTIQHPTVNLATFPDLVVIYLGMRVRNLRGLKTVIRFGPRISAAVAAKPDGLLLNESVFYSVYQLHFGMRQCWRDFESLENWSRALPPQEWWKNFLSDSGGVGFWHEAYLMRGGIEAILRRCQSADRPGRVRTHAASSSSDVQPTEAIGIGR
jgi:hypothetical protein